jgi:propionyl-CoA carboxylase alpha chain
LPEARIVRASGSDHTVRIERFEGGFLATVDDGKPLEIVGRWLPGQSHFRGTVDGIRRVVRVARQGSQWLLNSRGATHRLTVLPAHVAPLARHMIEKAPPDLSRYLLCPMPGLLTALHVEIGDRVEAGQPLAVIEAMKMENILRAQRAGVVSKVEARPGDSLAVNAVILEFERKEGKAAAKGKPQLARKASASSRKRSSRS